jgi:hypothetical protein
MRALLELLDALLYGIVQLAFALMSFFVIVFGCAAIILMLRSLGG